MPEKIKLLANQISEALVKPDEATFTLKEIAIKLTINGYADIDNILQKGTAISVICANEGKQYCAHLLGLIVVDFCGAYNVVRPISDSQAADIAEDLILEYWFLKIEDVVAFFQLCKKGAYGKVLDRLDPGLIFEWLGKYCSERENKVVRSSPDYSHEQPRPRLESDEIRRTAVTISTVKDYVTKVKNLTAAEKEQ